MIQDIAPHKYYVDYQPSVPNDTDLVLIYGHHTILCNFEDPEIRYPSIAEITAVFPEIKEKAKFLFRIDETDYYELRSPQLPEFGIWKYVPGWLGFAGITGYQIHTWYTDHTYCGRCGTKMHAPGNERAMQCPSCGALSYPVICPSVIVAITDGDRLLLTKYAPSHSSHRQYALVAGYTEVGETLEQTVHREVMEEVGSYPAVILLTCEYISWRSNLRETRCALRFVEIVTFGLFILFLEPRLVVITITPLDARIPYNADAACPFSTFTDSISSGLISMLRSA